MSRGLPLAGLARGEESTVRSPDTRRSARWAMNQLFFEGVFVDEGEEVAEALVPAFEVLLDPDLPNLARQSASNPRAIARVGGSREDKLVGAEGLEPPTSAL